MKAILLLLILLFNVIQSDSDVCDISRKDRVNCGSYFSMSKARCEKKGCCYKPNLEGSPWCYKRKVKLIPRPEGEVREDLENGGKKPHPDVRPLTPDDIVIPK